ncbi:PTS transporter subunit EIIB [Paenibacillus sp. TH7-28]
MERNKLATEIVRHIGGPDNVSSLIHCMTRLRFTLKESKKVSESALKSLNEVIGTTDNGGQYQIIIGNDVPKVYQEVIKLLPANTSAVAAKGTEPKKMNIVLRVINVLSSAMAPIVPALAGAGILKVILSLLVNLLIPCDQTFQYTVVSHPRVIA